MLSSVAYSESRYKHGGEHGYYDPGRRRQVAAVQLEYLNAVVDGSGSLLDVGAGDGAFVRYAASQGWDAFGIDPAGPEAELDDSRVMRGYLGAVRSGTLYDVVTLFDVVEHLEVPAEVLAQAYAHVRPGGLLLVETGNYQSGARVAAGRSWWCYAWDHRWYLSPPAVERMVSKLGAERVEIAPRVLRPNWHGGRQFKPWLGGHLRRALRRPWRAPHELATLRELHAVSRRWPEWSNLEIFTVIARRPA